MAPGGNVGGTRPGLRQVPASGDQPGPERPVGRSLRTNVLVLLGILGILANALPQLATGWPGSISQWVLLIIGALSDAVLVALSLDRLLIATPGGLTWVRRLHWPVPRAVVVAFVVVVSLLIGIGFAVTNLWFRVDRHFNGCPEPTELRILTTPEGADPTRQLADAYEQLTASRDDGCRTVSVYVYSAGTAATRVALVGGWSTDALRDLGPRPDVWLPDSTLQLNELLKLAAGNGISVPDRGEPYRRP